MGSSWLPFCGGMKTDWCVLDLRVRVQVFASVSVCYLVGIYTLPTCCACRKKKEFPLEHHSDRNRRECASLHLTFPEALGFQSRRLS